MKKIISNTILIYFLSFILILFRIFKVKKNRIICFNFNGKGYGDSPKYIIEYILKQSNSYDIYWVLKDMNEYTPQSVKKIKKNSFKYFYIISTSKFWISNNRLDKFFVKRKSQIYIQTWHSPLRLKKIEMDAINNLDKEYLRIMKNDSKNIDYVLAGCDFSYNIYKNSFLYNGPILKTGTPRCDVFFDKDIKNNIRKNFMDKYNINLYEKKIILYAPTFRKNNNSSNYLLDTDFLSKELSDEYIILFRAHPGTKIELKERMNVYDVTNYSDMQELLIMSDILITDYSSCSFDMLIANKPCILLVKDLDEYLKKERELYFNFEELPFIITNSDKEVLKCINTLNEKEIQKKYAEFNKKINNYEDGNACKKVYDLLFRKEII